MVDIPDDVYDPSRYAPKGKIVEERQEQDETLRCGSISYTKWNPGLLVFLSGSKQVRQLQYVHLQDDGPDDGFAADGKSFSVLFAGYHTQRLTVKGRNLKKFYDAIAAHRLCTLRALDRDFEVGSEPVVTSLSIERVEEPEGRA